MAFPSYHCKSRLYVIQIRGTAFVKIGRARDPLMRAASLQSGCPYPLDVRGYIQEDEYVNETTVHQQFKAFRIAPASEWFVLTAELREWMSNSGIEPTWSKRVAANYARDVRAHFPSEDRARLLALANQLERT